MSGHAATDWQGAQGDRWLQHIDRFESMIAQIGHDLVAAAGFKAGETVADVGCGGGPTSLEIAQSVGSTGSVTGVDVAPQLIALATRRAKDGGQGNATFVAYDAQRATPDAAPFDRLFSRFGVMFFDDSDAAFRNMRSWLKPSGRIDFACWASPEMNPWMGKAMAVINQYVDVPPRDPAGPGPFRFADAEATKAMLERTGFSDVHYELRKADQPFGGENATPAEAAEFILASMDMADAVAKAGEDAARDVRAKLAQVFQGYVRDGSIMMPGACWFFHAKAA